MEAEEDTHEDEFVEETFIDSYAEAPIAQECEDEEPVEFVIFNDNYDIDFFEETPFIPVDDVTVIETEPEIIATEEIQIEPNIEEVIVEEPVIEECVSLSCGSSSSEIDYQVTFVAEHCTVLVKDEEALFTQTVNDEVNFDIICEEGYLLDLDSIIISDPLCEEILEEKTSYVSNIHNDIVITIMPTYLEVTEEESDEPLLIKEEKQEILDIKEVNNDTAIMNTTIISIGICEVLAYILVKRKRHLCLR